MRADREYVRVLHLAATLSEAEVETALLLLEEAGTIPTAEIMRNPDKYHYVEVALPKENSAIERMVAESERLDLPLRVLIKQACINAYTPDEDAPEESTRSAKPKKKPPTRKKKATGSNAVPDGAADSASAFLDEGF